MPDPITTRATPRKMLDLTRDLEAALRHGTSMRAINRLLAESLDALGRLIPFDLATVMELEGDELRVRVARGMLADERVHEHRLPLSRFPSIARVLAEGHARAFTEHDHAAGDGDPFDGVLDLPHGHSCMVVPLVGSRGPIGIITLDRKAECGGYPDGAVEIAYVFGKLLALALGYGEQSTLLSRLVSQLDAQNRVLAERVDGRTDACALLESSRSPAMTHVVRLARQVAPTNTPVLITGETGTGKEVLASAIHGWSDRSDRPLVSINCAALPAGLIESELFGHVKGAFSGATSARVGRFQAANGGTLFLDEIGELPLDLQPKLLRALQEGCFEPVGSDRTIRVDVRIIAATNVDLRQAVESREFREDLYYRLAVFPIAIPPLRARREDIPIIAQNFLDALSRRTGRGPWRLSARVLHWLERERWRGNVRELVNWLERATILVPGSEIDLLEAAPAPTPIPTSLSENAAPVEFPTLEEMERRHIRRALDLTNGKIYGPGGAGELLGINANTLRSRMRKLGLGGARDYKKRDATA